MPLDFMLLDHRSQAIVLTYYSEGNDENIKENFQAVRRVRPVFPLRADRRSPSGAWRATASRGPQFCYYIEPGQTDRRARRCFLLDGVGILRHLPRGYHHKFREIAALEDHE